MDVKIVTLPQCGYLEVQLEKKDLSILLDEIADLKDSLHIPNNLLHDIGKTLVGNIKSECRLIKSFDSINELLKPLVSVYLQKFDFLSIYDINFKTHEIDLFELWVNFQSKTEFNPVHQHAGLLSFVIWIDIPYTITEENEESSSRFGFKWSTKDNPNKFKAGTFEFVFATALRSANSHTIYADKSYNFRLILFPSALSHTVYPFFSSDEYRISVSGNLGFNI